MKNLIHKLLNLLNRIPKDRYQHFTVGAMLAALVCLAALPLRAWWPGLPLLVSMTVVLAAALVKERQIDARADLWDILWTLAGGAVVWAGMLIALFL